MKNPIVFIVVAAILAGSVGFYGGIKYQQSKRLTLNRNGNNTAFQRGGAGQNRQGMMGAGERPISGEITAIDTTTLTLKLADGSTKIVVYGDSTKINKSSEGNKADLKVGEKVMTIGTQGNDGTLTAQSITLGGIFMMGGPAASGSTVKTN